MANVTGAALDLADDDSGAPWMLDVKLGGISPAARKASWLGEQRKREIEAAFEPKRAPQDDWQPPAHPDDSYRVMDHSPLAGAERTLELNVLPPLTLQEWKDRDLPVPDFLLGNWLSTTSRVLITAATGLGKSNFAIALGIRVAAGLGFLHWQGRRAAKVLYIDGEMSRRLLKQRVSHEAQRLGVSPETFYVLSHEDIQNFRPLNAPEGQACINGIIRRLGRIDLIILDNIMCLTCGNMKDEEPWQQTLPWVQFLTRNGVGQVWIHHTGHDSSRSYGTKTREWQMDTVAHFDVNERANTDLSFSIKFSKARERTPSTRFDFQDVKIALINDHWEHEVSDARRSEHVPPQTARALDALTNVIAGDQAVTLSGNRRVAKRENWQAECVRLGLIDTAAKPASARTLFAKFRRELVAAHRIACEGEFSWLLR